MASIDVMSDSTGKAIAKGLEAQNLILSTMAKAQGGGTIDSFASVQAIVRAGLAPNVFSLGDQFQCEHETYGTLTWEVIGFDHDTPTDETKEHSMTIQLTKPIRALSASYCYPLVYSKNLVKGTTYYFTIPYNDEYYNRTEWDAFKKERTFSFTYDGVSSNFSLVVDYFSDTGEYDEEDNPTQYMVNLWSVKTQTGEVVDDGIEALEVLDGAEVDGTELTVTSRYIGDVVDGNSVWKDSAIRRFLNGNYLFDEEYYNSSFYNDKKTFTKSYMNVDGFLNGLDKELLSVIGEVKKRNYSHDKNEDIGVTSDKIFLLSASEVYGSNDTLEGEPYAYYKDFSICGELSYASGDPIRIKPEVDETAEFPGEGGWLLRGGWDNQMCRTVDTGGYVSDSTSTYEFGIIPACCIV